MTKPWNEDEWDCADWSTPDLIAGLQDLTNPHRADLAAELGVRDGWPAIDALRQAIHDIDPGVRAVARLSLMQLMSKGYVKAQLRRSPPDSVPPHKEYSIAWTPLNEQVEILMSYTLSDLPDVVAAAVEAVTDLGVAAVPFLIPLLKPRTRYFPPGMTDIQRKAGDMIYREIGKERALTATILGTLGASAAVQPLIDVLEDDVSDVRLEATRALGKLGDSAAIAPLTARLVDSEFAVRAAAAGALRALGYDQPIPGLEQKPKAVKRSLKEIRTDLLGRFQRRGR